MADVASAAGVSVMTVSYTFGRPERVSAGIRERVEAAAASLNYRGPDPAARSLARGRTNSIGVIVGEGLSFLFEGPASTEFLAGIAEVCVEYEQNLLLIPAAGNTDDVSRVQEAPVDSYIYWTGVRDGPVLERIVATGKRIAIQGPPPDSFSRSPASGSERIGVVTTDDRAAACAVTAKTFASARAPAVVSFPLTPECHPRIVRGPAVSKVVYPGARARLRGIQEQCRRLEIPWRDVRVAVVARNNRADSRALVSEFFAGKDRPDAVVAMSDELAFAVMDTVGSLGLQVPADVALSGWDDSPAASAAGLTTVRQSLKDQGARCALFVLGQKLETDPPSWTVIERASTRRLVPDR